MDGQEETKEPKTNTKDTVTYTLIVKKTSGEKEIKEIANNITESDYNAFLSFIMEYQFCQDRVFRGSPSKAAISFIHIYVKFIANILMPMATPQDYSIFKIKRQDSSSILDGILTQIRDQIEFRLQEEENSKFLESFPMTYDKNNEDIPKRISEPSLEILNEFLQLSIEKLKEEKESKKRNNG